MRTAVPLTLTISLAFAASAETGTVYARSAPPGARVYVDDSQTPSGQTPTVIRDLSPGRHRLRFVFPDGRELVKEVAVQAGELASVSVSAAEAGAAAPGIPRATAVVKVVSDPPGAEVSVDGKPVGRTTCTASDLAAGKHTFVLKKAGCETHETTLDLKPGETRLLQAKLNASSPEKVPEKTASVPKKIKVKCPACDGTGHIETMGCPRCKRTGWGRKGEQCAMCGGTGTVAAVCPGCGGRGVVGGRACRVCGGTGKPKCPLCKGTGEIEVENPDYYKDKYDILTCPVCGGSGLNEHFKCKVCTGTGTRKLSWTSGRWIYSRVVSCWFCKRKSEALPRCPVCHGTGVLGAEGKAVICFKCGGTGKLRAPCPACRGRGWIKKLKRK